MEINEIEREIDSITHLKHSRLTDEEDRLAEKLKSMCDAEGKELDFKKSAAIFHELGKEYRARSPDQFSLIKSAVLYNAAIARSPENVAEIENDLRNLCQHVLTIANAKIKNADLIAKSKNVKQTVIKWRDQIEIYLCDIQQIPHDVQLSEMQRLETVKIDDVQRIQSQIANFYIEIMAEIASYCEHVMGDAPFSFAIAGMGSLARKEITPYSDFEHVILLSNDAQNSDGIHSQKRNYFRWFTVIFQMIIVNLQETLIPSAAIVSLNTESSIHGNWFYDCFTQRGISFDGMMDHACKFPLGRQQPTKNKPWTTELIKTVDEMINYLSSEESLKNGYHLSDILTKTCFVYKDKHVFNEFQQGIYRKLEETTADVRSVIKKQVADDLENFATRSTITKLKTKNVLNVKQIVYRSTTLFISGLGRLYNVRASSSFEVIEQLVRRNIITEYAKHHLMYAVALACEIRLKWYAKNKQQCDVITSDLDRQISATTKLSQIVGKISIMKYFQIAYALQCDVAKRLSLQKKHFYSNPHLFNLSICHCFDDYDQLQNFLELPNQRQFSLTERYNDFDNCLKAMDQGISSTSRKQFIFKVENCKNFGFQMYRLGQYDDALECFENMLALYKNKQVTAATNDTILIQFSTEHIKTVAYVHYLIGKCLSFIGRDEEARQSLQESLKEFKRVLPEYADAQYWIGRCLLEMKRPSEAIKYLQSSMPENVITDEASAQSLYWIGYCFVERKMPLEAEKCLKKCLNIQGKTDLNFGNKEIADTHLCYGRCLRLKCNLSEALDHFKKSFELRRQQSFNAERDLEIANSLYWIGICEQDKSNYTAAIENFKQHLNIIKSNSLDENTDIRIADAQFLIGSCLMKKNKANEAVEWLENSLKIRNNISVDVSSDLFISKILKQLSTCLLKLHKTEEALEYFKEMLPIQERISTNLSIDKEVVDTLDGIAQCLVSLNKHDGAVQHIQRALDMKKLQTKNRGLYGCCNRLNFRTTFCCIRKQKALKAMLCYRQATPCKKTLSKTALHCFGVCKVFTNLLCYSLYISYFGLFIFFIVFVVTRPDLN